MWLYGQYADQCGTSMSAPAVAATAALVWSRFPTWTASQFRERLQSTAVPRYPASQYGSGRVDALNAVHGLYNPSFTASISGPTEVQPGATCSFSAATDLPGPPYSYAWYVDYVQIPFDGPYYYHTAGSGSFGLMVTVTNSQGRQASGLLSVGVNPSAPQCLDQ